MVNVWTEAEFWACVDRTAGPEKCWPWMRARAWHRGVPTYGIAIWQRRTMRAHRLALLFVAGEAPEGRPWALHLCDNPPCCNPRHLAWGTPQENTDQMWAKGRGRPHPTHGTFNGHARLTNYQVREIRSLYPSLPQVVLAEMFGVRQTTISAIVRRKQWTHLP